LSIAEGFFESRILFALVKLQIFELIGQGEKSLTEIATELEARPETIARLLNAGVVLNLLESGDGSTYRINPNSIPVLSSRASDSYLGNWLSFLDYLYSALSTLDEAALKGGPTIDLLEQRQEKDIREFTLAMHNYAELRGKELVHFLNTSSCKTVLDLGCGPGTYAFHLGMHNPDLVLYLLDLPAVLQVTKEVQARCAIGNEIHYLPLDVTKEEIPGSYDIILVSNTLHMLGEQASLELLKRLYKSVNQGGSVVVQAQFLNDDCLGGRWPIILDLIQLCITSMGRNHTVEETRRWLEKANFSHIQHSSMSIFNINSLLRGYKM
jgi:SAM-dependent methyltransferase